MPKKKKKCPSPSVIFPKKDQQKPQPQIELPLTIPTPSDTVTAPIYPNEKEIEVKPHISAPSYFISLAENNLPPFVIPVKEPRPMLLVSPDRFVTEQDVLDLIETQTTNTENPNAPMKLFLDKLLRGKDFVKGYELQEREFLINLMMEAVNYGKERDFDAFKLSMLMTAYLDTHKYFKWYYWSTPENIWNYFQEIIIRLSIQDSPTSQEVFTPNESWDILTHFHTLYISNLPLIHITVFGVHCLKLTWPFLKK